MTSHFPFPCFKQKFSDPHCASVVQKCILTLRGCYGGEKANLNLEIRSRQRNTSDNIMQVRVFKIGKHY